MKLPELIALDLDGTLLPESKQLTQRSRRILAELERRGTRVTLATGKFLHLACRYARQLGLNTSIIALDGARTGLCGADATNCTCHQGSRCGPDRARGWSL